MKSSKTSIGESLQELLKRKGMSQKQLAVVSGLHPTQISEVRRGLRRMNPEMAVRLEHALGIRAEFLMNLQMMLDVKYARTQLKKAKRNGKEKDLLSPPGNHRSGRPLKPPAEGTAVTVRGKRSTNKRK